MRALPKTVVIAAANLPCLRSLRYYRQPAIFEIDTLSKLLTKRCLENPSIALKRLLPSTQLSRN